MRKVDIRDGVFKLMEKLMKTMQHELRGQGHVDTGRLHDNMTIKIKETDTSIVGQLWLEDYYVNIEFPMVPGRVPYSRGSGASMSKMIEGLMRWFARKGVSNAKAASFATANKWLQEGRPTRNSYGFSSNGRRTGFVKHSVEQFSKTLEVDLETMWARATQKYILAYADSLDQLTVKRA